MSEHSETEERNNEDTNPSRMRVVAVGVGVYLVVAFLAWFFLFELGAMGEQLLSGEVSPQLEVANVASPFPTAVYLTIPTDSLLTPEQMGYANMRLAYDTTELATILGNYPEINLIYIHPGALAEADAAFLQQQYRNGKLIAALNTPLSVLAEKLGVVANQPDLPYQTFATAVISVSAIKQLTAEQSLQFTNGYNQFDCVPLVLDGLQ
jgi:hypothetical protein